MTALQVALAFFTDDFRLLHHKQLKKSSSNKWRTTLLVLFQTNKGSIWSLYCHLYLCVVYHAFLFWAVTVNTVLRPLCCRFTDIMDYIYPFAMKIFNDLSDKWKGRVLSTEIEEDILKQKSEFNDFTVSKWNRA